MNLIHLSKLNDVGVVLATEADQLRNTCLASLRSVTSVSTPAEQELVVVTCRHIKGILADMEVARETVKAPVLDIGRRIDSLAKEFAGPIRAEMGRVAALVTAFQETERVRVESEERARAAAIAEAQARAAQQQLLAATMESAMTDESDLERAIIAEAEANAAALKADALIRAPLPEIEKARGQSTRPKVRWEVVDLKLLAISRPDLVKIIPRTAEINIEVTVPCLIPGLRSWEETVTEFRRL